MKAIPLGSSGHTAYVDDCDYAAVSALKWWCQRADDKIYARSRAGVMHRVIFGLKGNHARVHHWDGNGLNNCRANVAVMKYDEMQKTRRKRSPAASIYKGVTRGKAGRWRATIKAKGQKTHLGTFDTEFDAALAYDKASRAIHGPLASTNERLGLVKTEIDTVILGANILTEQTVSGSTSACRSCVDRLSKVDRA